MGTFARGRGAARGGEDVQVSRSFATVVGAWLAVTVLVDTVDLRTLLPAGDGLYSILPDWTGRVWFASKLGTVGWIDPSTHAVSTVSLGEAVANSFAVDETGGVFVVTDQALYRLDRDPDTGVPTVTWRETYDRGIRVKPGQVSQGSGTSPTLMGSDYVAIADNADPQLHVLVYRRTADPTEARLVCSVPLFGASKSASENSFLGTDTSLIVENNYGYRGTNSVSNGKVTQPGVARVDLDPTSGTCSQVWLSQERVPSSAGKLSLSDGLVYVYTKDPDPLGTDPWNVTANDFETGATVYKALAGVGSDTYDSRYGALSVAPDGAVYVTIRGGLAQLRAPASG